MNDKQTISRLRRSLLLLFFAMSLPIAALIAHAYSQLKWESFHRHRLFAEELSNRIDANLGRLVATEQNRPVSDYAFINTGAGGAGSYPQRSPLSSYPQVGELPGILGYFQIDAGGRFSTPLLPLEDLDNSVTGFTAEERVIREAAAARLQSILGENQLLGTGTQVRASIMPEALDDTAVASAPAPVSVEEHTGASENESATRYLSESEMASVAIGARVDSAADNSPVSQVAFDKLNSTDRQSLSTRKLREKLETIESVSGLNLDSSLDLKSERYELKQKKSVKRAAPEADADDKELRDQGAIQSLATQQSDGDSLKESLLRSIGNGAGPIEFSMLDSGHFILFRRVWNEQQRLIQGLLLDQAPVLETKVGSEYRNSSLSDSSNLVVAFNNDVLQQFSGATRQRYPVSVERGEETLLYRHILSAPIGALQLIYTVRQLPAGPGASVLSWVSLAVALVFAGGFFFLYKLGLKQIALATQQRNFVSSVSHELKTPLTSIRMYSEMLKAGWASEEKKQTYYQFIHDESERLSRLISNVLKLSSIQNNALELDLQPVLIADLMQLLETRVVAQFQQHDFVLGFDVEPVASEQTVLVDEDSFTQVIINLVDNALKFSRSSGRHDIDIKCRLLGDQARFSVRDYGPGVPADQLRNIFQLFYRPENELTRETVGTGIGLSIVNQLVKLMHGSVDVVNMDPGAEFQVILPVHSG